MPLEQQFLLQSGEFIGAFRHIGPDDQETLKIELISDEAVKTSEIEGEILDRASVQSSLRHQFGLGIERPGVKPAERGISKMMVDLFRSYATPLTDKTMFDWHAMLLSGDRTIKVVGGYRTHAEPMQVVSGPDYQAQGAFRGAAVRSVCPREMKRFIAWFNDTAPGGRTRCRRSRAPVSRISISYASIRSRTATAASAARWRKNRWRKTSRSPA